MSGILGVTGLSSPYSYITQPMSGKLEVPVQPTQSLFAQFQFVRGIPSLDGGMSIDRVQMIDSLLAQINSHRQRSSPPVKREELDLARPEETIQKLSKQAFQMQDQANPFQSWGNVSGLVLDVKA